MRAWQFRPRPCLLILLGALSLPAAAQVPGANPHIIPPTATPDLKAPDAPQLPYHFIKSPQPMAGQKFGNVSGVALTPRGHLLVFNRNPVVMMSEFDASGKLVRTFNPNIAVNTHGLRVDRHGDIWAIDSFLNVIWKLDPAGSPLLMLGTRGEVSEWREGTWNGIFNQPLDVAFDRDDNFYVVQSHGGTSPPQDCTYCATYKTSKAAVAQGSDPRLLKFDKNGRFLASRSLAHEDGNYPTIHTVIVTPRGEVWVGDRQANAILVFNAELEPLRRIPEPNRVSGLFVDAKGALWMSSGMDGMVMTLSPDGKITGWIGKGGRTTDPDSDLIGEAHYLVVTPDQKTIYIADSVNAKVAVLKHN